MAFTIHNTNKANPFTIFFAGSLLGASYPKSNVFMLQNKFS